MDTSHTGHQHEPWNKGKLVGQKVPFKLNEVWAIRVRLLIQRRLRELALFNLGVDSKLRACDLVSLRVRDVCHGDSVATRAVVMQHKTQRPVQFEITPPTREAVGTWIRHAGLKAEDYLFPSRLHRLPHVGTRQYARLDHGWVGELGLDPATFGTHSIHRTKPTLIYRRAKNLRTIQLLLGHTKLESTVRYLASRRRARDRRTDRGLKASLSARLLRWAYDRNAPALDRRLRPRAAARWRSQVTLFGVRWLDFPLSIG